MSMAKGDRGLRKAGEQVKRTRVCLCYAETPAKASISPAALRAGTQVSGGCSSRRRAVANILQGKHVLKMPQNTQERWPATASLT